MPLFMYSTYAFVLIRLSARIALFLDVLLCYRTIDLVMRTRRVLD